MKKFVWLGALVAFVFTIGCASLPVKQRAVASLAASETALEAAHDAERALCSPTAAPNAVIRHCDGAAGLPDAAHQKAAVLFSKAFATEVTAATALKVWRAGDPVPSTVAEYQRDLSDLLAIIAATVPKSQSIVAKIQTAVDEAAKIAVIVGVK